MLPQVFGDPDVKYLGGCNFIYTSIFVAPFGTASAVQTMGFHRSTDCGHTWEGPFVIDSASNPNGFVDDFGNPFDAADKEQIDVDRATGRVIISWTNFSLEVEISTSYSDNVLAPVPTWSPRVIVGARPDIDGQAATPRFGPLGSNLAYAVWETSTPNGLAGISFARSTDNGASFAPPIDLDPGFFFPDQVLGNDRIHWFPTLAVDRSDGRNRGTVYVVYGQNNSHDGGDVVVQTSKNNGKTFGKPVFVTARPGADSIAVVPLHHHERSHRTCTALLLRPGHRRQRRPLAGQLHLLGRWRADMGGTAAAVPASISCWLGQRHEPAESRGLQPGRRQPHG